MSKTTIIYKDIAPGAAEDASITSVGASSFSAPARLAAGEPSKERISCEENAWGLNGLAEFLPQAVPFWSAALSGADCVLSPQPVITVEFDAQYSAMGVTLVFDAASGAYCRALNIKWYQGATLKADADFSPSAASYFCRQSVSSFNKIVITLKETSLPKQYAKLEQIIFGVVREFGMDEIRNAKITSQLHPIAAEIPVNTLNWTLESHDIVDYMFQMKQPVEAHRNGALIGVYYIDEHSRGAERTYSLKCKDAFGVLSDSPFAGGVYSGKSAKALLSEIIGGDFTIAYDANVTDTALTGVIKPGTKRDAMQQVLFAWGVCAATDGTEGIRVFSLPSVAVAIGEDKIYTGASVDTAAVVTQINLTAHAYAQSTDGDVEIGGVKYKDTKTIYTIMNPNVTASDKKNVVEVTEATLVSPAIGQAVAQRIYDYYARRNTAKTKIVWNGELLGDCVTIPNAWGGSSTGNITKMDLVLSNTVAADCEVPS